MKLRTRTDALLLIAICGFLFFYGLGSFGLVGADEPRYAQVAREMLDGHDWVTPTLQGKAWLEKPPLYYWQAMISYQLFGVSDRAARIPAAFDAALLIAAIYLFLRRMQPGSEIDGALITAGCAGIVGFARGASTDMPLAAALSVALLAWYYAHQHRSRRALTVFYACVALGMLAKGPVAVFLAGVILVTYIALKRDWRALSYTLWIPGIVIFLAVAAPWFVAVQSRNPEFFRVFILEHNLGRFGQDLYHHRQPFWFYIPVVLLALMPWSLWLLLAIGERLRLIWSQWREAWSTSEDSWRLFLLIWLVVPVAFFSLSQSKLPGYILPAIPAGSLLVAGYLRDRLPERQKVSLGMAAIHGVVCGLLVFGALAAPQFQMNRRLTAGTATYVAVSAGVAVLLIVSIALARTGLRSLRSATLIPVVLAAGAIVKFASPALDATQSARPIAQSIVSFSHEPVPVAVYRAPRQQEYGLEFYLNRDVSRYEAGQVPAESHVLIAPQNSLPQFAGQILGRHLSYLAAVPGQKLDLYWVK